MSTPQQLVDEILGGQHDQHLDAITEAASTRRKVLARVRAMSIDIGDTVRTTNVRPKYLSGIRGTIVSKSDKSFRIELDTNELSRVKAKGGDRYLDPFDSTIGVPHSCVEPA